MDKQKAFENYPFWFVLLANLLAFSIYALGFHILLGFSIIWSIFYLLYCLLIEFRLVKENCVDCYYYGKRCFSGRGLICSLFFKKGTPSKFINRKITWKDFVPDFMVFLIPFIGGAVLLFFNFSWLLSVEVFALFILGFFGNAFIRGSFACKFCKQKEIGCPAMALMEKNT